MDNIRDISIEPLSESKYVKPFRVRYTQNGRKKIWDCIRQHNSISIIIYNKSRDALVFVSQFRPAVYMTFNKDVLDNSSLFKNDTLQMKPLSANDSTSPASTSPEGPPPEFGPSSGGITYELCAGIVDKQVSLEQIAKEEVLEETGYDVPIGNITRVTDVWGNIGTGGTHQVIYYCEVSDDMLVSGSGGGNPSEGEMIEVIYVPVSELMEFLVDSDKKKSVGSCFGIMWFLHQKKKQ